MVQVTPSTRDHWTTSERPKQVDPNNSKDPVSIHEEVFSYKLEDCQRILKKPCTSDKDLREKCYSFDSYNSKLMAQSVKWAFSLVKI